MKVIDSENRVWFLFEHEGYLYLDANCNMNAFGYTYMIQLNETELESYRNGDREYLSKLAHNIHYSVPIAKDTTSIYKGRNVTKELSGLAAEAVNVWRKASNGQ